MVFGAFVLLVISLVAFNLVQKKYPQKLPENLRTWQFLPNRVYDALCFVATAAALSPASDIYVDVEKNVIVGGGEEKEKAMKAGSGRVGPLATENMYASVKSFNMNPTVVEDVNEAHNDDFDQQMTF